MNTHVLAFLWGVCVRDYEHSQDSGVTEQLSVFLRASE